MNYTIKFVTESNLIEGIIRDPTFEELDEHNRFVRLIQPTLGDLKQFVNIYEPGVKLRDRDGMDVFVGEHLPIMGGPAVPQILRQLLDELDTLTPFQAHLRYETLHPFMDCNGRSGRVLWAWQMKNNTTHNFLHAFYYQALGAQRNV